MIYTVCSVRDRRIDAFMQPIFVAHVGAATRAFQDEVNKAGSPFNNYPEDFELYEIGSFDDHTASMTNIERRLVTLGTDVIKR